MTTTTYYWHDYETFGTDPQRDRACQFAGIRTDPDFNVIGEPLMLYCKTADDYLPNPEACLITGITPQLASEKGVCEAEFIAIIHEELSQAGTCGIGYNSIRFDDEVTRNLLYRNFYDPYAREWQNGNSRWDLIDVARATRALRPDGIHWPVNDDGTASFRLEVLTQANGISHQAAHDALSDVYATIALARLIKQKQPKLYDYLYANRHKPAVLNLLQLGSFTPLVHVSGRFPARTNCLAIVVPLYAHPRNSNEVIVYDLSVDPAPLLELSAEEIQQRVFVANDDLPEGVARIPLKTVHINKSPVLAPLKVIRQNDAQRLELDLAQCRLHLERIKSAAGKSLEQKLATVFTREYADTPDDPDVMIYSGGFFSHKDKNAMQKIRQTPPERLAILGADFDDARLPEMLFRYRGRNYPHTLNQDENQRWQQFCRDRLIDPANSCNLTWFNEYLQTLQSKPDANQQLLKELQAFSASKQWLAAGD
ncbi:exodeoxyribonuclease I [Methylomonas methanica]|uniref:Exodeoxyribonuclease I n=1 Tax=Methylomonas methanica (strain DSM 25384 / MC09) TaxID=857087 RepID=F9ZVB4_METMM|nr:exodeoxyribonuclease I [Methylomonas methanica]AEG00724.1 Exodeoxyribonuclease I [Methylomonas methanica MC09]